MNELTLPIIALVVGTFNVCVACYFMYELPEARQYWRLRTRPELTEPLSSE